MTADDQPEPAPGWLARHRGLLMIGVPLLMLVIGLGVYLALARYVGTDDAYIRATRVAVSTNISERVRSVEITDNQRVHRGEVLFRLDDQRFVIAERNAEARLAATKLDIEAMQASYRQRLADLQAAEDELAYQQREYARQKRLAASGIASGAQLDKAAQAFQSARQSVEARQQEAATVLANLGGNAQIAVADHPLVRQARAALDRAKLDISYATVYAPIDGIATKVDRLQPGDYVTAATPLFALVSTSDVWVVANYKETSLTHMRVGQKARIEIDAWPDRTLSGRVASISPGTGASFSVLPPENATGNWVKVVQRVPVRLSIDDPRGLPLSDGLSASVRVDTQYRPSLFGWL
ncbi:MAG TPA: HlyD family secretion protein [Steroidobacteraceae bacterium]|nr:HlyD family secretion protein [Steroidobacteraceae bacterium]